MFYLGSDLVFGHERLDSGERRETELGVAPLLGASVAITPFFALSIEPRVRVSRSRRIQAGPNETWMEVRARGVGQLRLNVRF
jgi:hypothetical protein